MEIDDFMLMGNQGEKVVLEDEVTLNDLTSCG